MKRRGGFDWATGLLAAIVLLAACSSQPDVSLPAPRTPGPGGSATAPAAELTKAPAGTAAPVASPAAGTVQPGVQTIGFWMPSQFDPNGTTLGADKLRQRLEAFQTANPGIRIQVRLKGTSGTSGLLESLAVTSSAAPANLPGLILLSRQDLETAALRGLISPLSGLVRQQEDPDWYAYARQISQVKGVTYGLPFAGDAQVLVYRPARIATPPADWTAIMQSNYPVSFAAADPQANLTLQLYLSLGGTVSDAQGMPALQADVLARVLRLFADAVKQGVMPGWLATTQNESQAWQAFRDQRANWLVTWSSRLLAEPTLDTAVILIPPIASQSAVKLQTLTLANGWLLAIPQQAPEMQKNAIRLAEELTTSEFQTSWTAAAGYLPARPTALAAWPAQSLKAAFSPVVLAAQARPGDASLGTLGTVLMEATLQVIRQQADPTQAAQSAADKLASPPSR